MKLFIYLLLFFTSVYATPDVSINSANVEIRNFKMSYYIDKSENLSFNEILKQNFIDSTNKITLGKKSNTTWARIVITNKTEEPLKIFIHDPFAYSAKRVEFYETEDSQLIRNDIFDLNTKNGTSKMYGANAIFDIELNAGQTKTVYIKSQTFAYQYFSLSLYSEVNSKKRLVNDRTDIALLIGVLLSLAIYNMLLFFSSGYKENLYYSLFLWAASIWISLLYGLTASLFHIYGDSAYQIHSVAMTLGIFLVLFFMNIFETKENYKTEHKFLASIALLYAADMLLGFFNIFKAMELFSLITIYTLIVFLWVSISITKKGNRVARLFLIGHSFFAVFSAIGIAFFLGKIELNYVTSHATGIGYSIEAFMLAYIISYKIKLLENRKEELLETLEEKVSERTKELSILASTDPMTKLYNRRYFTELSESILDLARREKADSSIIILDIDMFKNINDTYGHKVGDIVIKRLADTLRELTRKSDIISRWGGEEFVILLPNTDTAGAHAISEKIRSEVEHTLIQLDKNRTLRLTVSIGLSQIDILKDDNIEVAIHRADEALYEAKESGRNKVCEK